jgi:hypothetical protein
MGCSPRALGDLLTAEEWHYLLAMYLRGELKG